jgi:hypothetical protein
MNYDYLLTCYTRLYSFNCDFLKCGLTPTYYNYNYYYILVGTALKTVTWVAETCRWLLRNKNTFISSSAFVGPFENFIKSDECTEHGTHSDIFCSPQTSRPALQSTQPPVQWVHGFLLSVKRPWREADHSPQSRFAARGNSLAYKWYQSSCGITQSTAFATRGKIRTDGPCQQHFIALIQSEHVALCAVPRFFIFFWRTISSFYE